jgi:hypothetical protein
MKLTTVTFAAVLLTATTAGAQERRALEVQAQSQGGKVTNIAPVARIPLEAKIVKGAPYSAEVVSEFTQTLPDGNRIVRRNTGRVFRDGQGRTRREDDSAPGQVDMVRITDPVANVSYTLIPASRTVRKMNHAGDGGVLATARLARKIADPAEMERKHAVEAEIAASAQGGTVASRAAAPVLAPPHAPGAEWGEKTETLPSRMIEGVMAEGTRITRTIPAGGIGNEQPIVLVTESWYSPDLQVMVLTRTSDPRSGEMTYKLANITRGEPNPTWFEVPGDYTVKEYSATLAPVKK